MAITQVISPLPAAGKRGVDARDTFVTKQEAFQDALEATTVTQLNTFATQANSTETNVNAKEAAAAASATSAATYMTSTQNTINSAVSVATANALASANNAATSAATATAAANRAEAVVIPTNAAYSVDASNWRDTMMSKAEFNAMAAERRANRAGSGFDEFGKMPSGFSSTTEINNGIAARSSVLTPYLNGNNINLFGLISSKISINGVVHKSGYPKGVFSNENYGFSGGWWRDSFGADGQTITMPPAPTVLPHTATLTQQQIDSGVIKHADASNSGLIVNGKFDTDTSGWSIDGTASWNAGAILLGNPTRNTYVSQSIATIVGKKYTVEVNINVTSGVGDLRVGSNIGSDSNNLYFSNWSLMASGRYTAEFTATTLTSFVSVCGSINCNLSYDNIAVFPADAISRSDLTFLESWHEDVSEKDFVYPLGNVQYLATTGDAGTTVVGAFAGAPTYSLFSDTWQADSALVGRGYVWSTLSDANKKAFVANPENNCYLDGDKVIQVRYRVRVVMGLGDSWLQLESALLATGTTTRYLKYSTNEYVKPKGKKVTTLADIGTYNSGGVGLYWSTISQLEDIGAFKASNTTLTGIDTTVAYEGKCYLLPIALVHRRNQGGYNLTYNPHGTKTMTMTPTSIADCFTEANYTAATGYIGTSTSRPDGLFYDQVSVEDFKPANKGADLRNTSKKRNAQNIIEEFAPKAIAGTIPYYNNDTTALTTYKDAMEVRDTSGNRYGMVSKVGNVVTINSAVANKKGFSVVTLNGKQYLQVADDAVSDTTLQMNLSTIKYDIGVFDA